MRLCVCVSFLSLFILTFEALIVDFQLRGMGGNDFVRSGAGIEGGSHSWLLFDFQLKSLQVDTFSLQLSQRV